MAILDTTLEFSTAEELTSTGATISENIIDLGATGRTVGNINYTPILFTVNTTFTSGGAATLQYELLTSDNADMSSPTVLHTSGVYALADLAQGKLGTLKFPDAVYQRYISLRWTVGTAAFTAGAISAQVAANAGTFRTFDRGYTVA